MSRWTILSAAVFRLPLFSVSSDFFMWLSTVLSYHCITWHTLFEPKRLKHVNVQCTHCMYSPNKRGLSSLVCVQTPQTTCNCKYWPSVTVKVEQFVCFFVFKARWISSFQAGWMWMDCSHGLTGLWVCLLEGGGVAIQGDRAGFRRKAKIAYIKEL